MLVNDFLCNKWLDNAQDMGGSVTAKTMAPIDNSIGRKASNAAGDPPAPSSAEKAVDDLEDLNLNNIFNDNSDDAPPEETGADETKTPEDAYADDAEFLAELDPELANEYPSIREAILGLRKTNQDLLSKHEPLQRFSDKIENVAKAMNMNAEEIIDALVSLDPSHMDTGGPVWENVDKFVGSQVSEQYRPFYKGLIAAISQDLRTQLQGEIARSHNTLRGGLEDLRFEGQMKGYLSNPQNAERSKGFTEKQIKDVIQQFKMTGKSNAIDWAVRFLLNGSERPSEKKAVTAEAKKVAQDLMKKTRENRGEPAGKTIKPGAQTRLQKAEAIIDEADRKGISVFS